MTNAPDADNPQPQQPVPPAPPAYGENPAPAYGQEAPAYPPAAPAYGENAAYGQAPAYPQAPGYAQPPATIPGRTMGIVAFILSLVGLITSITSLVGLILGIVALVQSRKAGHKNGYALAAIIIGAILTILSIIAVIALIAFFVSFGSAVQTCVVDPTATVNVWGIPLNCADLNTTP
ncbi:DUF4190 domain-containing protein [Microbacterium sp.]|uniref:DUF4190 domain-containing protein n=1 Tax=Microbacterium sp. TaxID=51671 RepID=UPI003A943CB0